MYFFLCSTTKCDIRQLPSFHVGRCNVTEFDDGSMNLEFSGIIGFDPFVRVFKMSEASPAPMLFEEKMQILIKFERKMWRFYWNFCSKQQIVTKRKWDSKSYSKSITSIHAFMATFFTCCNRWHRLDSVSRRIDFRWCISVHQRRLQQFPSHQTRACSAVYSRGLVPSPFRVVSIWVWVNRLLLRWVSLAVIVVELKERRDVNYCMLVES